jgi:hypothetical protein
MMEKQSDDFDLWERAYFDDSGKQITDKQAVISRHLGDKIYDEDGEEILVTDFELLYRLNDIEESHNKLFVIIGVAIGIVIWMLWKIMNHLGITLI